VVERPEAEEEHRKEGFWKTIGAHHQGTLAKCTAPSSPSLMMLWACFMLFMPMLQGREENEKGESIKGACLLACLLAFFLSFSSPGGERHLALLVCT
jgi:hypothetical protein